MNNNQLYMQEYSEFRNTQSASHAKQPSNHSGNTTSAPLKDSKGGVSKGKSSASENAQYKDFERKKAAIMHRYDGGMYGQFVNLIKWVHAKPYYVASNSSYFFDCIIQMYSVVENVDSNKRLQPNALNTLLNAFLYAIKLDLPLSPNYNYFHFSMRGGQFALTVMYKAYLALLDRDGWRVSFFYIPIWESFDDTHAKIQGDPDLVQWPPKKEASVLSFEELQAIHPKRYQDVRVYGVMGERESGQGKQKFYYSMTSVEMEQFRIAFSGYNKTWSFNNGGYIKMAYKTVIKQAMKYYRFFKSHDADALTSQDEPLIDTDTNLQASKPIVATGQTQDAVLRAMDL